MSFEALPTEALQIIFSFTTWTDQLTIGLVCRRWAAAVEPMLLVRTRLKVSLREVRSAIGANIGGFIYQATILPNTQIHLMDKKLLLNSNRSYSCLGVEWGDDRAAVNMTAIEEALVVCQQQFLVKILYLKGPLDNAVADLLLKYHKLLENLHELHFEDLRDSNDQLIAGSASIELSLPNLKQLSWIEHIGYEGSSSISSLYGGYTTLGTYQGNFFQLHATLNVPELERLRVRVKNKRMSTRADLDLEFTKNCYLFLPSLYLKSCSKLQHVDILHLNDLDQSHLYLSESILQNFKTLKFLKCGSQVIKVICGKCSNLEELIVDEPLQSYGYFESFGLPFQISADLSRSLKKLTLNKFNPLSLAEEAVFPELRCLTLRHMNRALSPNSVTLIAPQLTTLIISRPSYDRLRITHKDQIRTMVVHVKPSNCEPSIPPPENITELTLYESEILYGEATKNLLQDCLSLHANLRRLTVVGSRVHERTQLNLKNFSNLQYLCASHLAFRLTDFYDLTQLKSLILSYCSIITCPGDGEVKLNALEYMRMEGVIFKDPVHEDDEVGWTWDHFPIHGSGRQPPVVNRNGVFWIPMFHLSLNLPKDNENFSSNY